ncbi:MAG TPA: hypothetical protein VEB60_02665 [Candidatus Paceibacterota bacterium]|nr:hypothetical protein [Candidatus Paceibacterota bacterium]
MEDRFLQRIKEVATASPDSLMERMYQLCRDLNGMSPGDLFAFYNAVRTLGSCMDKPQQEVAKSLLCAIKDAVSCRSDRKDPMLRFISEDIMLLNR